MSDRGSRRHPIFAVVVLLVLATLGGISMFRRITPADPHGLGAPDTYGYLAIVAVAFLASAALIALRWPTVRGARVYALLAACVFILLSFTHTGRPDILDGILYWGDALAGALAPALLVHLGITLTRRTAPARKTGLAIAYSTSVAAFAAGVWLFGLGGAQRFHDPARVAAAIDRLQVLMLSIAVSVTAYLLWKSFQRSSSGLHRSQVRWILWGLGLGLAPLALLSGLPWLAEATAPGWVQFLSVLPVLVIPAAFTTALVRYRLHDLDVILRRGLAEVAGIFCLLAIYAVTKAILAYGLVGVIPLSPSGLRYVAILVAAVAYLRARSWVRTGVDRAFYQARYSFRTTLLEFGRELNLETDLPSLAARLSARVRETLDVPEAHVLVRAADGGFESAGRPDAPLRVGLDDATLERLERDRYVVVEARAIPELPAVRYLFGMRVKDRLRAVLATAERPDTEPPLSSEDRALLASLSAHAAAAIEAARLLREVRDQARHVEALKVQQELILESSTVGLLLLAEDGRILAWNRALEAIYGRSREQTIGKRLEEVFPLHLVRRLSRELDSLDPAEEARIYRETLVNEAGQRVVVDLSVSAAGADLGARVITVGDVTERVKLEEEVLRGERLASLGLLAAGVAHEVNTPLTGISGYVQMLLDEVDRDDPRRELLEKIEAQSRRASSIANSLLDLARPERASLEETSLNDLIREVLGLFDQQVRGRDIRIATQLDPALPLVRAHRGKLQQVLLNLLLNARDALDSGGTITVVTGHDGSKVQLEVQDDGTGIAEEDLPRIFDPFFTTKRRGRGTGLGLSISYGIVQEHDGTLSVESAPGSYTRFRVELPVRRAAASVAS